MRTLGNVSCGFAAGVLMMCLYCNGLYAAALPAHADSRDMSGRPNIAPGMGAGGADELTFKAWSIRLLTFKERASAELLVQQLGRKGFYAKVMIKASDFYLVRIVNIPSLEQAKIYRERLLEQTNLDPEHIHIESKIGGLAKEEANKWLEMTALAPPLKAIDMPLVAVKKIEPTVKAESDIKVEATESIILHVSLNAEDAGSHFLLKKQDDILVSKAFFLQLGLKDVPMPQEDDSIPVALRSLKAWLSYTLDNQTGELALMVDPSLLPSHKQSLMFRKPSDAARIQNNAVFINYSLDYQKNSATPSVVSVPVELGVNIGGVSVVNTFSYQQHQSMQRRQTQITYDNRERLQRWILGDVAASSGAGIGGAVLGGINISSNYGIRPDIFTSPPLQLNAMLTTPSEVEVIMNGQSIYKANFPAGALNLANIPYYNSGSGKAELIVRDAFGRERLFSQSLYTSSSLLAPGLAAYNYSIGREQKLQANGKIQYGKKTLLFATHSYGVANWLTPGFGFETDGSNVRGGLLASMLLGNYGQLDVVTAASRRQGVRGSMAHVNYNYVDVISPNVFFTTQSPAYGGILEPLAGLAGSRWNGGASLAVGLGSWGSVSGRWTKQVDFAHQYSQSGSVLLSASLPAALSLTTQWTRAWTATKKPENQMNASLGRYFNNGVFLTASYSRANRTNTFAMQIQYSPPLGEGFGYHTNVSSQPNGQEPFIGAGAEYRNQYAEFAINHNGTAKTGSYDMHLRSALLWVDGGVHVSRPIRDSFALVRVNGMEHVQVSVHHQPVGETDSRGEMVVPFLYAYSDNDISINPAVIPLGYTIDTTSKAVTSSYRGGGVVEFNVLKMQTVEGKVFYRQGGALKSAQYSAIDIHEGAKLRTSIIGDGGVLYLENISAGTYPARVYNQQTSCRFNLVIPESDRIINDIGDVVCEFERARDRMEGESHDTEKP